MTRHKPRIRRGRSAALAAAALATTTALLAVDHASASAGARGAAAGLRAVTASHRSRGQKHNRHKQGRNAAQPRRNARQSSPCYAAFPDASSKTIGKTTWYNRQESMRMVLCYGFGLDPSADFPISASMVCGVLAQAIGLRGGPAVHDLSLFADGACSGDELASDPSEPAKYIGVACGWVSDILGVLAPAGALGSLGCALAPSVGHSLGSLFESAHEFGVAVDVVQHGKCIKYSPTHFGSPWLAVTCAPGDPGFSNLPLAVPGGSSGSGGSAGGGPSGGGGATPPGGGGGQAPGGGGGMPGSGGGSVTAVAAGRLDTCALLANGSVDCWGANGAGELGNGTTIGSDSGCSLGPCEPTPVKVTGIATGTATVVGGGDACALLSGHHVECWGGDEYGELGAGEHGAFSPLPLETSGIGSATAIASAGGNETCAIVALGRVECWGMNRDGDLGDGTTVGPHICGVTSGHAPCSFTPVEVSAIGGATAIAVAGGPYQHACAVLAGGTVDCWGANAAGELGDGETTGPETCSYDGGAACSATPVAVTGISNAVAVAAGAEHTCALLGGGAVECWGGNQYGQLGNATTTGSSRPVAVTGISDAISLTAGEYHTCALLAGGGIDCWGYDAQEQLGTGASPPETCPAKGLFEPPCSKTPAGVSGINTATAVAAGGAHTCALLADGAVECWGLNASDELGYSSSTFRFSGFPVPVHGIE